jgi:transcriptional regulator with XRE-family HTH domain
VTFQQIQKYEIGATRISAGRLRRLADALDVPVSFFFSACRTSPAQKEEAPIALLSTAGAIRLVRAFARIHNGSGRHALIDIAEHLARVTLPRR